jgi:RNA polymerase sigma factor (sigma-70 family)
MTTTQKFDTTYENKFKSLRPFLRHTARGNEDLIQEGAISILKSLKRIPDAPNKYLRTGARWCILNQVNGVGKSVDIPKRYNRQFPITITYYDAIPDNSDAELSQAIITDRNRLPLDEMVIRKLDFEHFINNLSGPEAKYIHLKVVDELLDREIAIKLGKSKDQVKYLKRKLRSKIKDHFAE